MSRPPPVVYFDDGALLMHMDFIRAMVRRYGARESMVEDLTQEVLIGAWMSMMAGRFTPDPAKPLNHSIRAWLSGIAFRQTRKMLHRRWVRFEIPVGRAHGLTVDQGPTPEARADMRATVRALQRLPRVYRDILTMTAFGATGPEVAEALGLPEGTVTSRLRHARQALTRAIVNRKTW